MTSINIQALARESVKKLTPYSSARDEFQGAGSVYLDANENPFNTCYNRYPDPHQIALKKKIAEIKKRVRPEQVFLGNGSDEAIDLLIRVFCEPGIDHVIIPQPTYGMYRVSAAINGVEIRAVQLTTEFDLDLQAINDARDKKSKLIFLCSPNNPSGNLLDIEKIKALLENFRGLVIVDEAYIDFTDCPGLLRLLDSHKNLVVLQTLSKAWGLAGLRLGMCFADPEITHLLNKIKPPYNINTLTQSMALEKLQDEAQKNAWTTEIKKQREILRANLTKLPVVQRVYPSDANFLLVKVTDASRTYQSLIRSGIIVRDRSNVILCENALRITVGTANENSKLLEALNQL